MKIKQIDAQIAKLREKTNGRKILKKILKKNINKNR